MTCGRVFIYFCRLSISNSENPTFKSIVMNLKKSLLILAMPALLLTACKQSESAPASAETATENTTAAVAQKPETASFKIDGMVCAVGCAKTIEKKLAKLDGVTKATVDYDKKEATVEFDAAKQSAEKIVEAVEKTGDGKTYKVTDVKSSGDQTMVYNGDPVKEKDKKKKKSAKKDGKAETSTDDKKEGCSEAKETKAGCCAAKKSCHSA